jgi:hypothetical protein
MFQFVLEMLGIGPAIIRGCCRHAGFSLLMLHWKVRSKNRHAIMEEDVEDRDREGGLGNEGKRDT